MPRKIFIWSAHPKPGSLSEHLADAYQDAAIANGAEVRRMNLSDMDFADNFTGYRDAPALEPDLQAWQSAISWADHLMFIHPYWWGAMPGRAKTVLDRVLVPGFAYKYRPNGLSWDKLLAGKTGDAVITSDTPPLYDTLIYRRPARRVIRNQVFGFCGVKTRNVVQFGTVKTAKPEKIAKWARQMARLGAQAATSK